MSRARLRQELIEETAAAEEAAQAAQGTQAGEAARSSSRVGGGADGVSRMVGTERFIKALL